VGSAALSLSAGRADIVATDLTGKVVRDTRAERIGDTNRCWSRLRRVPGAHRCCVAFSRATPGRFPILRMSSSTLYEIRDALSQHFGGEDLARTALRISKTEWQRLAALANVEPLEQGRHRGRHPDGRRAATQQSCRTAGKSFIAGSMPLPRWLADIRLQPKAAGQSVSRAAEAVRRRHQAHSGRHGPAYSPHHHFPRAGPLGARHRVAPRRVDPPQAGRA
jgi:hypothetical protein